MTSFLQCKLLRLLYFLMKSRQNVFCEKSCTSFIFLLDSNKWTLIVCIYQDLLLRSSTPLVPFWNFSTPLWKMTVGIRSTVIVIVPSSFNRKEGVKLFWIFFRSTNSYAGLFNNSIINNIKESKNKRKEKIRQPWIQLGDNKNHNGIDHNHIKSHEQKENS